MAKVAILSYIKRQSFVHELTGTTKLLFFLMWSIASMVTYDTRVLVVMLCFSFVIFKLSKIKIKDISFVLGLGSSIFTAEQFLCVSVFPRIRGKAL